MSAARWIAAFDVGGTHLRSARMDAGGALSGTRERPTPHGSAPALVAALDEEVAAQARAAGCAPAAVGLAIAGFSDTASGVVYVSPGLRLRNAALGGPLRERVGVPVRLVNDVNAAAWAEARARGSTDLVAVFVGTGVGTGLVSAGRLVEGRRGAAMEGGHVVYRQGGEPYPTVAGCYEAYLGGSALAARASRVVGEPVGTGEALRRWRDGELRLEPVFRDALDAMAALVRMLVTLADPADVVVGGGVARAWPELVETARAALRPRPLAPELGDIAVSEARCGDAAGLVGAGLLAAEPPGAAPA